MSNQKEEPLKEGKGDQLSNGFQRVLGFQSWGAPEYLGFVLMLWWKSQGRTIDV